MMFDEFVNGVSGWQQNKNGVIVWDGVEKRGQCG